MHAATEEQFEAFVWDNKFNTGIDEVDDPHHKLVELAHRLGGHQHKTDRC